MSALIDGMVAGYGIAIPVGAISVLLVSLAMEKGLRQGLIAAVAVTSVDLSFAIMAVVAGSAILAVLSPYEEGLRIVSGATLIGLGIYGLMRLRKRQEDSARQELSERAHLSAVLHPYRSEPLHHCIFHRADRRQRLAVGLHLAGHGGLRSGGGIGIFELAGPLGLSRIHRQALLLPQVPGGNDILGNLVVIALGVQVLFF